MNALIEPLVVGTMARFDVTAPSPALRVETKGCGVPCGHRVRKLSGPGGTTVALSTRAWADGGMTHGLAATFTLSIPLKVEEPAGFRVSSARHGTTGNRDSPPAAGGAKYPSISITRSESLLTNTETSPFVPEGTMAALAVTVPVGAFRVETRGCACPVGQVVRNPRFPLGTAV